MFYTFRCARFFSQWLGPWSAWQSLSSWHWQEDSPPDTEDTPTDRNMESIPNSRGSFKRLPLSSFPFTTWDADLPILDMNWTLLSSSTTFSGRIRQFKNFLKQYLVSRALIYPCRIRSTTKSPVAIVAAATFFCAYNGFLQGYWNAFYQPEEPWTTRKLVGEFFQVDLLRKI